MGEANSRTKRAALLVRCSAEEAERIRQAAEGERRTISGFILNAVMQRIALREKTKQRFTQMLGKVHKGRPQGGA